MQRTFPSRILAPTDFSALAIRALAVAVEIARRSGGEILLLHADTFLPPIDYAEIPAAAYLDSTPQMKEATERKIDEFLVAHVPPDVRATSRVVVDAPARAIAHAASEPECDLVVMGTHGRSGWRRALLGSVAEAALKHISCPVLTVQGEGAAPSGFRRIICPVCDTPASDAAARNAAAMAQLFGADLLLLLFSEAPGSARPTVLSSLPRDVAERTSVEELARGGSTADELLRLARAHSADMIVLGAEHRRFSDTTILGTTVDQVIRRAECPVLTIFLPSSHEVGSTERAAEAIS